MDEWLRDAVGVVGWKKRNILRVNAHHLKYNKMIRLYGPFPSVIRIRDEWFLDGLDGEIAT